MTNAGVGGNTVAAPAPTGQVRLPERLPQWLQSTNWSYLLIFAGINDVWSVSPTATCNALLECLLMGLNAGVATRLCTLTPFSAVWPYNAIAEANRQGINAWLRSCFGSTPYLLDFETALVGSDGFMKPEYSADGLHPNPYGHLRLADAAYPVLC